MPGATTRNSSIPLYLTVGDSFLWTALYQVQATPFVAPTAVDLTGYTVEFIVKTSATPSTTLFTWTTGNGKVTVNAGSVTGLIKVAALPTDTASATPGTYIYYLRITDPSGVKTTVMVQPFNISAGI